MGPSVLRSARRDRITETGLHLANAIRTYELPYDQTLARRLWAIAFCVAVGVGVYYVAVKGEGRSAFNRWRPIVNDLIIGEDIYVTKAFPTPPIMALVLYPFAQLSGKWSMTGWFAFKLATTVLVVIWILKATKREGLPAWLGPLALLLCSRPIIGDLLHGNVNLWILFLVMSSFFAFRNGRDWLAGSTLALAIACKLTPALVLIYFAWKSAWRVVAGALVGLVLWLVIVPGSLLGFAENQQLLSSWTRLMIVPYVTQGQVDTEQVNQSLPGLIHRLLTTSMAIKPDDGRPIIEANVANFDDQLVHGITLAVSLLVLVGLAFICRTPIDDRRDLRLFHELTIVLFAALVISERSWKHHYTVLVPSYFLLVPAAYMAWQNRHHGSRPGIVLWSAIILSTLSLAGTSKDLMTPFFGPEGSKWVQVYGAYLWATLLLVSAHIVVLRTRAPQPDCELK
jgi:hypothetical protein